MCSSRRSTCSRLSSEASFSSALPLASSAFASPNADATETFCFIRSNVRSLVHGQFDFAGLLAGSLARRCSAANSSFFTCASCSFSSNLRSAAFRVLHLDGLLLALLAAVFRGGAAG